MTHDDYLLDRALHEKRQQEQARADAELAAGKPCPPDPVLDELFKSFASQMNRRPTSAFVRLEPYTEQISRKAGGFMSRKMEAITTKHTRIHEVARGWPIPTMGRGVEIVPRNEHGWMVEDAVYGVHCLAVTTDGLPWIVRTDQRYDYAISYGPPLGPSLRAGIIAGIPLLAREIRGVTVTPMVINSLGSIYQRPDSNGHEELPAHIAWCMATVLDS
jgi:hypothetical protein